MKLSYMVLIKTFPINIFSGVKLYRTGGYLNKNKVICPTGRPIAKINVGHRGFFLHLFG